MEIPIWTLPPDKEKSKNFLQLKHVFSKEECAKIIETGKKHELKKAEIYNSKGKQKNIIERDSEISWIPPKECTRWIYDKLDFLVNKINEEHFGFNLTGFFEGLQFTIYKEPNGHFKKHIDKLPNEFVRKLTIVVQLSDDNDYEGGNLLLHLDNYPIIAEREIGDVLIFPSFTLHEVEPVLKGVRYSLITWVSGPKFV